MIKIRLARFGKKNNPFYRVVAINERQAREGESLDKLGYWHPQSKLLELNRDGIEAWVLKGAQISPAVKNLMENGAERPKQVRVKAVKEEETKAEVETGEATEETPDEEPVAEAA